MIKETGGTKMTKYACLLIPMLITTQAGAREIPCEQIMRMSIEDVARAQSIHPKRWDSEQQFNGAMNTARGIVADCKDRQVWAAAKDSAYKVQMAAKAEADAAKAGEQIQQRRNHNAAVGVFHTRISELMTQTVAAGYRLITLSDFVLDAQEFVKNQTKIAVIGNYYAHNSDQWLTNDENDQNVPLLTTDAPRNLRAFLMQTSQSLPRGFWGEQAFPVQHVVLTGTAVACTSNDGSEHVCMDVDGGWSLKNPDVPGTYNFTD
jgi:hypothetical protein